LGGDANASLLRCGRQCRPPARECGTSWASVGAGAREWPPKEGRERPHSGVLGDGLRVRRWGGGRGGERGNDREACRFDELLRDQK
jgi:hypothetical protein